MDKEEPNVKFLTVRWCLKLQRLRKKYDKQQEKRRFTQFVEDEFAGN